MKLIIKQNIGYKNKTKFLFDRGNIREIYDKHKDIFSTDDVIILTKKQFQKLNDITK